MAEGHPPGRPRRPRLHPQVEHGLDARHARVLPARPGPPQVPPPRPHLRAALRLHRELRAAAQPRRGRARQGLAAEQDAGRRVAALRQPARPVRLDVGLPRQASCCSWAARSRSGPSGTRSAGVRLARARRRPRTGACRSWFGRSTRCRPRRRRPGSATTSRPASSGSTPTTPSTACSASCAGRPTVARWWRASPTSRRCPGRATASACRGAGSGGCCSTPTRSTSAGRGSVAPTACGPPTGRPTRASRRRRSSRCRRCAVVWLGSDNTDVSRPRAVTHRRRGRPRPRRRGVRRLLRRAGRGRWPLGGAGLRDVAARLHRCFAVRLHRHHRHGWLTGRRAGQRAAAGRPQLRLRAGAVARAARYGLPRRLVASHFVLDESTALALAEAEPERQRQAFWAAGPGGVRVLERRHAARRARRQGASATPDARASTPPSRPASWPCIVPHLRPSTASSPPLLGGLIAIVLVPWAPEGVPILAASAWPR